MTHSPDHAERAREATRDIRNAMQRSLRSGHKQAHMNYGPLTVCLYQIDAAMRYRDRVVEAAQFLSDRLDNLEWMDGELESTCRDYMGHVDPAHARLRAALHDAQVLTGSTTPGIPDQ